jgi:hypothetical protein
VTDGAKDSRGEGSGKIYTRNFAEGMPTKIIEEKNPQGFENPADEIHL